MADGGRAAQVGGGVGAGGFGKLRALLVVLVAELGSEEREEGKRKRKGEKKKGERKREEIEGRRQDSRRQSRARAAAFGRSATSTRNE